MAAKSKDLAFAILAGIVVFLMFALKNSKMLYKIRPETFSEVLLEDFDSTRAGKLGEIEAFSGMHRVRIELPQHVKYYSKTDTLVSIFDTLGTQIGRIQSFRQLREDDQSRVKKILNKAK